jgi:ABC-2 type transport system permease protein
MNSSQITVLYTIVYKEIHRILRLWLQTILPPLINMSLYFFIFGQMIGLHIGDINNISYAQFITPGLIILATVTNAYMNASSSVFLDKFQGCLQEILAAPIPEYFFILAITIGSVFRGLIIGMLIAFSGWICVGATITNFYVFFVVLVASNCLFAILGILNGLYANHFDGINFVPAFILTPLTFLGGVFYPINRLPGIWQDLSYYNPFVYLVKAMRQSYTNGHISYVFLFFIIILSIIFAIWCTQKIKHRSKIHMR